MRNITFSPDFFYEYNTWQETNKAIYHKINELIINTVRDPFKGLGKPEPLKNNWKGFWSRRIPDEHWLAYKVENDAIFFASCHGRYH